jgi:hypothetical protein
MSEVSRGKGRLIMSLWIQKKNSNERRAYLLVGIPYQLIISLFVMVVMVLLMAVKAHPILLWAASAVLTITGFGCIIRPLVKRGESALGKRDYIGIVAGAIMVIIGTTAGIVASMRSV